jgi:brefeldin A-resistance guanine nucleotide exchange factor 1
VIFEHLSALLSASTHYSVLLIERAVVALFRLALILAQKVSNPKYELCSTLNKFATKDALRDQLYISLDLIANLPPSVANSVAEHVVAGVSLILQQNAIVRWVFMSLPRTNAIDDLLQHTDGMELDLCSAPVNNLSP